MSFTFRPAVREQTSLLLALAGASGSGKTYSAMLFARGLAGPDGRIAVIDTEAGRALHYADQFRFDHADLAPPFTPARYQEAIVAAEDAGYGVIVIDSMSHEYAGEGGIQEWAAELEAGTPKPGVQHPRFNSYEDWTRSGIEAITVIVDNDANGKGQQAFRSVARRWLEAGREVRRILPSIVGTDLNDLMRGAA